MTATTDAVVVAPRDSDFRFDYPPTYASVEEERAQRKRELAGALRLFGRFGFSEGVAGHITARDPEFPDRFWVNPLGQSFRYMKASDLVCVSHDGDIIEGDRPVNRAAFCIHSEVHRARPDAIAAAHSHSVHGKALSSLQQPLLPLTQDACAFYEDHGLYLNYSGVVTDTAEGERIAKALGPHKAVILANHGLLTVGHTVAEAAWWFITMERSCQAQLLAQGAGTPVCIDHQTAMHVRKQIGTPLAGWFQFRPLWEEILHTETDLDG